MYKRGVETSCQDNVMTISIIILRRDQSSVVLMTNATSRYICLRQTIIVIKGRYPAVHDWVIHMFPNNLLRNPVV